MALAAVLLLSTLILGVMGPFGTYDIGNFGERILYWGGLVCGSTLLARGLVLVAEKIYPTNILLRELVTISVFTMLFTPIVIMWTRTLFSEPLPIRLTFRHVSTYTALICIAISLLRYSLPIVWADKTEAEETPSEPKPATVASVKTPLYRRLPDGFDGAILRLSGDGHRVLVTTTQGVFDIRMRLSDAIAEMEGVSGVSSHRSHWVARAAIVQTQRDGGKTNLLLINGDIVPVSRKNRVELAELGLS